MLLILMVSCSGNGEPGKTVVDPTQRWLNAKCPPAEVCGPQRSPETLAIAWLEASENGLCSVLAKYTSPDRSNIVTDYCGSTESYQIEDISVKETTELIDGRPNLKEITMDGNLIFTLHGETETLKNWTILVEDIGGKWYVIDGYH